jgi:sarcosine oxidase subunit beta
MQTKAPGPHLRLAARSACLLAALASDIGLDYRPQDVLVIMGTWAEREVMETRRRDLAAEDVPVEMIEGRQLALEEPILKGGDFVGASLSPGDGTVDPVQLTYLFARAASRNGAILGFHSPAIAIRTSHGRVTGVETIGGLIPCGSVVVAAGLGTGNILRSSGLHLPVRAVRGQLLVSEPLGVVGRPMVDARYIALKHNPGLLSTLTPPGVPTEVGFGLEQTACGNLLIGNTREPGAGGNGTSLEALEGICRNAARIAPGLRHVRIIRAFAGLRPYGPDSLPFVGSVGDVEGLYLAGGMGGDGITLSAAAGAGLAGMLTGEESPELAPFSPCRFRLA